MRFTEHYRLGSVVPGDFLDPLEDSRRFLVIDRQLLGLFQVLGNGVSVGWTLTKAGGLSISISPGRGNVFFMSGVTNDVRIVSDLTPNATNYIYAQAIETTRFDRDIRFFADTALFTTDGVVLLGAAITNDNAVEEIDLSDRADISFIEQIKDLINQHRHRGGSDNPTKIDLTREVTGQLPGFHIEGIDASKIVSGTLSESRIPLLEHGELLNSGVLTHAQLDSFVRNLTNPNVRLLGELSATNLLQLYMAFKHVWNEVDAYATNMLVMIPGITPNSFTDLVKTTAVIDTTNHLIQGVPSIGGSLVTTTFSTSLDFNAAKLKSNMEIGEDSTGAFFRLTKPFTEMVVESFDNIFQNNTDIPGWTLETIASQSTTSFKSDSTAKVDGPFSVKFNVDQTIRVQATKTFTSTQDWTAFNELESHIQTKSAAHGKIIFQILKKNGSVLEEIDSFTMLETNETTVGFRKIIRDITNVTRDKVDAIRIYTDTALGWDLSQFIVNVDRIRLNNNLFYSSSGRMRFRLKTPQKSHWAAISWTGDNNGGVIQARARTAPSYETFDQSTASTFSSFFSVSGGDPDVTDNRAIELEIALSANASRTSTPVVRSVTVSYITANAASGLTVDTTDEFLRASKLENAEVATPGDVLIDGRIDVGDVVYGLQHSLQQSSLSDDGFTTVFGTPVVGITGTRLPLSPIQAAQLNFSRRESNLEGVASVERLMNRDYLTADTLNDRIIVFDRDGGLVKAFASNNVRNIDDLYPLTVAYNERTTTLYITWSTNISLATMDLSKMILSGAGLSITLSNVTDKIVRLVGPSSETTVSNVSPILLSVVHAGQLESFLGDASTNDHRLFLSIETDAVKEGIDSDNSNFATLVGPRGMPVFVGDITFIKGLNRPISISRTSADNWLIGNAKPLLTGDGDTDPITGIPKSDITSIIEIDPDTGEIVFADNSVDFSLLTLGGAVELNERYVAVAGIVEGEQPDLQKTTSSITATVGGGVVINNSTETTTETGSTGTTTTTTDAKSDVDVLESRRGVIKIVEKRSGRVIFEQETSDGTFAADIQLDEDDNLVTIEKSFGDTTTAGRVIKLDEDGNVFYQFGLAELSSPNDVRVLSTGNLVVST